MNKLLPNYNGNEGTEEQRQLRLKSVDEYISLVDNIALKMEETNNEGENLIKKLENNRTLGSGGIKKYFFEQLKV